MNKLLGLLEEGLGALTLFGLIVGIGAYIPDSDLSVIDGGDILAITALTILILFTFMALRRREFLKGLFLLGATVALIGMLVVSQVKQVKQQVELNQPRYEISGLVACNNQSFKIAPLLNGVQEQKLNYLSSYEIGIEGAEGENDIFKFEVNVISLKITVNTPDGQTHGAWSDVGGKYLWIQKFSGNGALEYSMVLYVDTWLYPTGHKYAFSLDPINDLGCKEL